MKLKKTQQATDLTMNTDVSSTLVQTRPQDHLKRKGGATSSLESNG